MSRLQEVLDRPEPVVIITIAKLTTEETMQDIVTIRPDPVAEIRIDKLKNRSPKFIKNRVKMLAALPLLFTIRSQEEDGEWTDTEAKRLELYLDMLKTVPDELNFDGTDVEIKSEIFKDVVDAAHDLGKIVIASNHDFQGTPSIETMEEKLAESQAAGADFTKLVTTTNTMDDVRRLTEFTIMHSSEPIITLGTGKLGALTRIALPAEGSNATYAHSGDDIVAEGQMHYRMTNRLLTLLLPDFAALAEAA